MHSTRLLLTTTVFIFFIAVKKMPAQLVAGPMPGYIELRTAKIWVEVKPGSTVELLYWKKGENGSVKKMLVSTDAGLWFAPIVFDLVGLDINTTYEYAVAVNSHSVKKPIKADGEFTTQDLWQWRKPAPDFSFLTGSCAYFNEPVYDRPGPGYGKDSSIFETMAKEKASFMLWLGDNWYLREADYYSQWGIWYRASRDRKLPILQNFLKSMPQFAIWDDHDYGPNDGDKSFHLKETSRKVFMSYWANPGYGEAGNGIYTRITYADCDFFLMDDRYFRSNDDMEPYAYDKPNIAKRMWGAVQMEWLKNALLHSKAPFKFIVTGSQTLNPASPFDCLQDYPIEFNELMGFLSAEKINGVLFLTGDRHHSEVIRYDRREEYTLYDITSSPLTSSIGKVFGKEKENPARITNTLAEAQNYSRISISGKTGERKLTVEFVGIKGEKLAEWSISEKELKNK